MLEQSFLNVPKAFTMVPFSLSRTSFSKDVLSIYTTNMSLLNRVWKYTWRFSLSIRVDDAIGMVVLG